MGQCISQQAHKSPAGSAYNSDPETVGLGWAPGGTYNKLPGDADAGLGPGLLSSLCFPVGLPVLTAALWAQHLHTVLEGFGFAQDAS